MTDITEVYYCPDTGCRPAPPACPSCDGRGWVVVAEPAYTDLGLCRCTGGPWWRERKGGLL